MSDDVPTDDSIVAISFQGLAPSEAQCLLEMLVMGFGSCNALATFSRLMPQVLDLFIHSFVLIYLDGIYIFLKTSQEHLKHLQKVLTGLRENDSFY
jgi:hypothetical protein